MTTSAALMGSPGFQFESKPPGRDLEPFVETLWFARGMISYRRERIAPTGSTVAIIVLGDPIRQTPNDGRGTPCTAHEGLMSGPHDRPVLNEPLGQTHAVGIVTTPVGCEALFGVQPSSIKGAVLPMDQCWPAGTRLRPQLTSARSHECFDLVEEQLRADLQPVPGAWDRCCAAISALEATPSLPIAELAATCGVSHHQLNRDFTRVVGLSPRALGSILRVRQLLGKLAKGHEVNWPQLASEGGWYDQAHLIRDVRRYTGVSPTSYLRAQRELLQPEQLDDAIGFVPEA